MKFSLATVAAIVAAVDAHTIFQKVSVNGVDQGQLKGVRATASNNPIENVNSGDLACNFNIAYKDSNIINVPAGARVGAWWGHVIGGPQGANDPDHPIASSHKGPALVYLAKVDNAASTGTSGLRWFKIAHEGLSGGKWGVDSVISNGGWQYFTMPSCIAPGNYLMRVELIGLHNAGTYPGAQFYMGCAQINVSGSGSNSGSNFVSFPGAYSSSDPGVKVSIYSSGGKPDNGGRAYTIPGPAPISCSGGNNGGGDNGGGNNGGGNNGGGNNGGGSGGGAALYGQCGGIGWNGPTTCAQGSCKAINDYYSQCQN